MMIREEGRWHHGSCSGLATEGGIGEEAGYLWWLLGHVSVSEGDGAYDTTRQHALVNIWGQHCTRSRSLQQDRIFPAVRERSCRPFPQPGWTQAISAGCLGATRCSRVPGSTKHLAALVALPNASPPSNFLLQIGWKSLPKYMTWHVPFNGRTAIHL